MFSKDDISMPIHLPQVILGWLLLFYNIPQKVLDLFSFLFLHRMSSFVISVIVLYLWNANLLPHFYQSKQD